MHTILDIPVLILTFPVTVCSLPHILSLKVALLSFQLFLRNKKHALIISINIVDHKKIYSCKMALHVSGLSKTRYLKIFMGIYDLIRSMSV